MKDTNMLSVYLRNEQNEPYALLVSDNAENRLSFGFSVTSVKDHFSRSKGRLIAKGRLNCRDRGMLVPDRIRADFLTFVEKSRAYYTDLDQEAEVFYNDKRALVLVNR